MSKSSTYCSCASNGLLIGDTTREDGIGEAGVGGSGSGGIGESAHRVNGRHDTFEYSGLEIQTFTGCLRFREKED